jgi:hypothetical protein
VGAITAFGAVQLSEISPALGPAVAVKPVGGGVSGVAAAASGAARRSTSTIEVIFPAM